MIQNRELYEFGETTETNEAVRPVEPGTEPEPESEQVPPRFIMQSIISILVILIVMLVCNSGLPGAGWIRSHLHTALQTPYQKTFGLLFSSWDGPLNFAPLNRLVHSETWNPASNPASTGGDGQADERNEPVILRPLQGQMIGIYGWQHNPVTGVREFNPGVEFSAIPGTPIVAVAPGRVEMVIGNSGLSRIEVAHAKNWRSVYQGRFILNVRSGQEVAAGDPLAFMSLGSANANPKLNFMLLENGEPHDPTAQFAPKQ